MAEHLASIFGTEKDRVNCPFYFKIGACRHGDRCSRLHNKPTISPTLLLANMYQRPDLANPGEPDKHMDPRKIQEHFEDFYEDLFEELSKYGEIESLNVCDNVADHMVGNVYVNYREEEQAATALRALTGRFYAGRPILVDFSPVTDFREATCRQFEENTCNRGGYCNFMHLRKISRELRRKLFGDRRRSRSRSPRRQDDRRGHGGPYRGGGGRDDRGRYDGRGEGRRPRDRSRERSPVREGSAERRARIEQWNREREERDRGAPGAPGSGGDMPPGYPGAAGGRVPYAPAPPVRGGYGPEGRGYPEADYSGYAPQPGARDPYAEDRRAPYGGAPPPGAGADPYYREQAPDYGGPRDVNGREHPAGYGPPVQDRRGYSYPPSQY